MTLLGLSVDDACEVLNELGFEYECISYYGIKPYENADIDRVVRATIINERKYQLIYCSFITYPQNDSQG